MARGIRELAELRRALRRERVFRDRRDPLDIFTNEELVQRYRFSQDGIMRITNLVAPYIEHETGRSYALLPHQQVLIALQYYASGTFQRIVGDPLQVSRPTACRAIHRVTDALVMHVNNFIRFVANAEAQRNMDLFFAMNQFPGVIGCVDGTHVWIISPKDNEADYVNRKGYHSINVQVMCDARGRWINVVARWPGSAHDNRILRPSQIWDVMEDGEVNGIILGDSGYSCRHWLMTPLLQPTDAAERRYNASHKHTCVLVEQVIGRWKRRFHVLHGENRMKNPNDTCKVIAATAILHNIAVDGNEPEPNDILPGQQQPEVEPYRGHAAGHAVRARLINTHFTN